MGRGVVMGGYVMDEGVSSAVGRAWVRSWGGEAVRGEAMAMERARSADHGKETAKTGLALSLIGPFVQVRVNKGAFPWSESKAWSL